MRLNEEGNIDIKVYVYGLREYYIEVAYPEWKEDSVKGTMGLGIEMDAASILAVAAEDCIEFYQGSGMSRFRGV